MEIGRWHRQGYSFPAAHFAALGPVLAEDAGCSAPVHMALGKRKTTHASRLRFFADAALVELARPAPYMSAVPRIGCQRLEPNGGLP
jgi:hypothetical protein